MTDTDTLAADMARLGMRPYSQVGVPMFVIAQDLTPNAMPRPEIAVTRDLAQRFADLAATLISVDPDPGFAQVARLVEVLADRHLLQVDGQHFTQILDNFD